MDTVVCGNPRGRTVFFIAGWPDSCDVFAGNLIPLFAARYRVVGLSLPGFRPGGATATSSSSSKFRYSLQELVQLFEQSIADAMKGDVTNRRPFIVAHDWGSILTFELHRECPGLFERIVALDVAGNPTGDSGRRHLSYYLFGAYANCPTSKALWMMFYQFWIMICYLLPSMLGDAGVLVLACWLNGRPSYRTLVPSVGADNARSVAVVPRGDMGWPYFHLWGSIFSRKPIATHASLCPVSCPVFYAFGKKKPMQFHSQQWLEMLQRSEGCQIAEAEGGHWFFAERSSGQICQRIYEFINSAT